MKWIKDQGGSIEKIDRIAVTDKRSFYGILYML